MRFGRDERPSSRPFISGDSFRAISGTVFERSIPSRNPRGYQRVLFAELESFRLPDLLAIGEKLVDSNEWALVLHNGDRVLSEAETESVANMFASVYCVNSKSTRPNVHAIPIGLENAFRNKNGKLKHFLPYSNLDPERFLKTRRVFSSFHTSTNPRQRETARVTLAGSRHGHQEQFLKAGEYVKTISQTKFVISPPGNGPDCHRNWEALYLRATPVVIQESLDSTLISSLPILEVESYEDFVSIPDFELDQLYESLWKRNTATAYLNYWEHQLKPFEK